jgi:putative transposase
VGEGGDEVSVARFIADQRTNHQVPHTLTCLLLGVSLAWFYKWVQRQEPGPGTPSEQRRAEVDAAVETAFSAARGLHGSPRLHLDLREAGFVVSEKTVLVRDRSRCGAKAWSRGRSSGVTA